MPTKAQPRVRIGAPNQTICNRLANLPVTVVGPTDQADLAVLTGTSEEGAGAEARKILDATGREAGNPEWAFGFSALAPTQPDLIARAARVSVPTASVVGAVALLRPLVEAGVLPGTEALVVSVSGEQPAQNAATAVMQHGRLPAAPRFEVSAQQSEPVAVRIALAGDALTVERAQQILASRYEHAIHVRVLPPDAPHEPGAGAEADSDSITMQIARASPQTTGLALTAWLDRDRTGAIVRTIAVMLGLETADEAVLLEQSDDQ